MKSNKGEWKSREYNILEKVRSEAFVGKKQDEAERAALLTQESPPLLSLLLKGSFVFAEMTIRQIFV